MDISTGNQKQTISDDQELAKVLAGVNQDVDSLNLEEATANMTAPAQAQPAPQDDMQTDQAAAPVFDQPAVDPTPAAQAHTPQSAVDPALASVKEAAITELRPLIDKLDVDPEEKFNTYLLLIRSTDDKELIAPAHEAAKSIADEAKKAQALLDIIKEIDFLSNPNQQQ